MTKENKILAGVIALVAVVLLGTLWYIYQIKQNKGVTTYKEGIVDNIESIKNLIQPESESAKLLVSETGDIYYQTQDDIRYVFPSEAVFRTWFPSINVETLPSKTIEELYQTRLGGTVFAKPTTLLRTETDPNIYYVSEKGEIRAVADESVLDLLFANNWREFIVDIENRFFTSYAYGDPLSSVNDLERISADITIEMNQ